MRLFPNYFGISCHHNHYHTIDANTELEQGMLGCNCLGLVDVCSELVWHERGT